MFNLSGSELVFLLLLALVILGPEKLPEALRKFGKTYAEVKKAATGFQSEMRTAMDEPLREMQQTANTLREAIEQGANEVSAEIKTTAAPLATQSRLTFSAAPPATEPPAAEPVAAPTVDAPSTEGEPPDE